ncbi:MAG: PaaI family thioesterase [Chloroflexota bacterium]|nr:PaaI family thioesterase [Chloroflexota bacterium]
MAVEQVERREGLQDVWPDATCYGCGPANPEGLRIKSHWSEDSSEVVCRFEPQPQYNAGFPNVMYGGLVASLIDCHSIWTAIAWTYREEGREHGSAPSISYVTGTLNVRFLKPTALDRPVTLRARVTQLQPRKALVECSLYSGDEETARGEVTAVRFNMDKALGA